MKKIVLFTLISLFSISLFAQNAPYSEFKAGMFNPKDAKTGWMFTYGNGKTIDEAFSWLVEFNLYAKNHKQDTEVATSENNGIIETQKIRNLEVNTYLLPILFKLTFDKKMAPTSPLMLRGSAGIGYQFLWNKEKNYLQNKKETRFYHGFAYQLSAGVGIEMSSSAILFVEGFYHGGKVKRNKDKTELGLPTWNEVNLSGPGIRFGINFVNFGLF